MRNLQNVGHYKTLYWRFTHFSKILEYYYYCGNKVYLPSIYLVLVCCVHFERDSRSIWGRKSRGENEEAREEKNKERPTTETPSCRRSLHKSLSPREGKSRIAINPTFPWSQINSTWHTSASAVYSFKRTEKIHAQFSWSAYLACLTPSRRQRPLHRTWYLVSSCALIGP